MTEELFDATMKLRFKNGALEQLFRHRYNGDFEWRAVAVEDDE